MYFVERHIRELKQELWRDLPAACARYRALFLEDPAALAQAALRAIDDRNHRAVIAIGRALDDEGALMAFRPAPKLVFAGAVSVALLTERRWQEALDLLERPELTNTSHFKYWRQRALALAGLGRLAEAIVAIQHALIVRPDFAEGLSLHRLLKKAQRAEEGLQSQFTWPNIRWMTGLYLELGLDGKATELAGQWSAAPPPLGPGDDENVLCVLQAIVEVAEPGLITTAAALLPGMGDDERLGTLLTRCQVRLGRAGEACSGDSAGRDLALERALACAAAGKLEFAIDRLSRLSEADRQDMEVRAALAYCVGQDVQRRAPMRLKAPDGRRRIFNLTPFNDELTMLKLKLAEMGDWVDQFVIVESPVTFTGQPKPLHFDRHKAEFAAYGDKLRHVIAPTPPSYIDTPWARDFFQRDMAISAIADLCCAPDDLVLLTDADEIVDREAIATFDGEYAGLNMAMYRFFLNYRPSKTNGPRRRTGAVWKARHLHRFGSSYARFHLSRLRADGYLIDRAGWHFTSVGASSRIAAKMSNYAHQEHRAQWGDTDRVEDRLARIRSGTMERGWERCEIDDSFPAYVREHAADLADMLL